MKARVLGFQESRSPCRSSFILSLLRTMLHIAASSERLKVGGVVSFYMFAALTVREYHADLEHKDVLTFWCTDGLCVRLLVPA
jgi:hypothetical protein